MYEGTLLIDLSEMTINSIALRYGCIATEGHRGCRLPSCSNFRVTTANFSDVQIFKIFTVSP